MTRVARDHLVVVEHIELGIAPKRQDAVHTVLDDEIDLTTQLGLVDVLVSIMSSRASLTRRSTPSRRCSRPIPATTAASSIAPTSSTCTRTRFQNRLNKMAAKTGYNPRTLADHTVLPWPS